jgi:hypothetical protein
MEKYRTRATAELARSWRQFIKGQQKRILGSDETALFRLNFFLLLFLFFFFFGDTVV